MRKKCICGDSRGYVKEGIKYDVEDVPFPYTEDYLVYLPDTTVYIHKSRFDINVKPLPTSAEISAKKLKDREDKK